MQRIFEKKLSIHRRNKRSVQRDGDFSKKWHKWFPDTNIDSRDRYIKCIHPPALIAWRDKHHLNGGQEKGKKQDNRVGNQSQGPLRAGRSHPSRTLLVI